MSLSPEEIVGIVAGTAGLIYLGNLGIKAVKKYFPKDKEPSADDASFAKLDAQARNYVGKTVEFKEDKIKEVTHSQGNKVNLARALTQPIADLYKAGMSIR